MIGRSGEAEDQQDGSAGSSTKRNAGTAAAQPGTRGQHPGLASRRNQQSHLNATVPWTTHRRSPNPYRQDPNNRRPRTGISRQLGDRTEGGSGRAPSEHGGAALTLTGHERRRGNATARQAHGLARHESGEGQIKPNTLNRGACTQGSLNSQRTQNPQPNHQARSHVPERVNPTDITKRITTQRPKRGIRKPPATIPPL